MSKYVATIMNRHFVSADNYIFSCRNVVLGDYDEDNKIFTDVNGNEYEYMLTEGALTTDIPYSVFNIVKIEEMEEQVDLKDATIEDKLGEYEDLCRKIAYYVGFTDDFTPFLFAINMDAIKNEASSAKKRAIGNVEDAVDGSMEQQLNQLMLDAIDDKYTKKELESTIDKLGDVKDWVENTISTLETKIESMEANKTFGDYLREQLDKPKDIVKPPALPKKTLPPVTDPKVDEIVEEIIKEKTEPKKKDVKIPEVDTTILKPKVKKIDIEDVYNKVTQTLIAQDEPARRVITEVARKEMHQLKKKEGILLTGPTGVGKTELMRLIAKYIDKPLFKVDSTQLTVPGYVGKDIEEVLWDLYVKCGKDKDKAEHAIIYFDEIDKKGSDKKNDVNGKGVLNVLLPFIEGSTYDAAPDSKSSSPKVKIDTSNMTVILGGAFTDVYKNLSEKNTIGFGTEKNSVDKPTYRKAETKDFVEHGLMTDEFMGRVTVVRLNDLDLEDLKRVMLEGNESALKVQEEIFNKLGVKIKFTDDYISKVAEKALEKKTGARGLNGIIDESTWKAFEEVYVNDELYSQVILTDKTVEDNSQYKLIKKRKKNKK